MRDRLLAVEGVGNGSVNVERLSVSPSFTPLSVSSSCHEGERSRPVEGFAEVVQRFFAEESAIIGGTIRRPFP